jgi:hypothetical protein
LTVGQRLRVFENWEMTEICGPDRRSSRRKLRNDELFDFLLLTTYYSNDQMKKNEMGRACCTHVVEEMCIKGFARKS